MDNYGLKEVYNSAQAKVDIVFLHGLRGDVLGTWTKDGVVWPKELLPKDVPESRIFLFGFDSRIVHRDQSSVTNTEIHSDANDLCAKLVARRSSSATADRPIILVGHSLGGLVAAQAFVHGEQKAATSDAKSIAKNLRGLVFLGTPFKGSPSARPAEAARKILKLFGVSTQDQTLKLLGVDSERLDELTRAFPELLNKRRMSRKSENKIEAFFFYETLKTHSIQIVDPDSAQIPGCGDCAPIRASHIDICRFSKDTEEGYSVIVAAIRKAMLPPNIEPEGSGSTVINVLGKAVNVVAQNQYIHGDQHVTL
ncbi:hypothetical protein F4821DRAFT_272559 [Hypoxylon rubiginosum]|uniref:Uncharacterized protein n=1 Tax=Hypoxylon rubiginosum TaxID=110542 RepID=A0ACC0CPI0_9PEZI|nr:hypothetical protein F4821DRAFT_272559 [Hypoxylon rubiginosum]